MPVESSLKDLEATYLAYEATLPVVPVNGQGPLDPNLVNFRDNRVTEDSHSWFHFKEGFSRRLLPTLLTELDVPRGKPLTLLDPFAGVGTTLLSAQLARTRGWQFDALGIERNPFLSFVANAKLDWHRYDPERLRVLMRRVFSGGPDRYERPLPEYSTLRNRRVYHPLRLRNLLGYREKIKRIAVEAPEQKFLLLGLASILEGVSGVRKDGRALRFVNRKNGSSPRDALRDRWNQMLLALERMQSQHGAVNGARVVEGDARDLEGLGIRGHEGFDFMVYSPPYLNNIDYTEVYKIELWMLGFVKSMDEFRQLKLSTLRSHPTANVARQTDTLLPPALVELLSAVDAATPADGYAWRGNLFRRYALDMQRALRGQFELLKPGGRCVCVVGNSLHGGKAGKVPVATDLMIALAARSVGYEVNQMYVARHLRRRDREKSPFLRESILVMAKPG